LKSVIADAHKFVEDYQVTPASKFDMIFMDINYEEDNLHLSPPKKFLETAFLTKLMVSLENPQLTN
jgi:hypothetical protein